MIRSMTADVVDLRDRRVYSLSQIDDVLGLNRGTASRWIDGYTRSHRAYPPVIRPETTGDPVATWGEFVECRLLSEYRTAGVPLERLRPVVTRLRAESNERYPLASGLLLTVRGRELVLRVQQEAGLSQELSLVVVRTQQHMMDFPDGPVVALADRGRAFADAIEWSGEGMTAIPLSLTPDATTPLVRVDPTRGFGDPVVRSVPTSVIAELNRSGDSQEMIAELYDLRRDQVEQAVRFELRRSAA